MFRKRGAKIIYDTDDCFELIPPQNCNYTKIKAVAGSPAYKKILSTADLITCTTDTLAGYLDKYKTPTQVIPNSIDPDDWHMAPRHDKIRVGWQGGGSHFGDLAMISDSVKEVQKTHDFEFVLMGVGFAAYTVEQSFMDLEVQYKALLSNYQAEVNLAKQQAAQRGLKFKAPPSIKHYTQTPDGKTLRHFVDKLKGIRYEFHPVVPIEEYSRGVSDLALDIGLAPLLESPFNSCRSCIKFYEYSACEAMTLASDALPYSEEVPWTVRNNRESWTRELGNAIENCRKTSSAGRTWVLERRNIQKTVLQWERALGVEAPVAVSLTS
jgi:glycosyltransferase involved in cell wall biosynthesis